MAKAKEILDAAKAQDQDNPPNSRLVLLHSNLNMVRLIAAWPLIHVRIPQYANSLQELWDKCGFPLDDWLALAGLPPSEHNLDTAENVIQLGMVYPDGTIPEWVNNYISSRVASLLE